MREIKTYFKGAPFYNAFIRPYPVVDLVSAVIEKAESQPSSPASVICGRALAFAPFGGHT